VKAFSPAGMGVKGFFGYGAKTFGNPDGNTSGNGQWAAGGGGSPTPPPGTLPVTVGRNYLDGTLNGIAVRLSQLLTSQELLDWQLGQYTILTLAAAPGAEYWIFAGGAGSGGGLYLDVFPSIDVTVNINMAGFRIYGGGGTCTDVEVGSGGTAIGIAASSGSVDLNIALSGEGRLFAGGGAGGQGTAGALGGGGAGGYFAGTSTAPADPGGVYDPQAGGSGNPNVAGGFGAPTAGNGGGLGAGGTGGTGGGGAGGGFAVERVPSGTTTITGGTAANLAGAVE
jgi:hypothetical protein